MNARGSKRLTALVVALIESMADGEDVAVSIRVGGRSVQLVAGAAGASPRLAPAGSVAGAMFSPMQARMVDALRGRGWMTTKALAEVMNEKSSSDFRCLLRNLTERGIVEARQRLGVRLVDEPAEPQTPE